MKNLRSMLAFITFVILALPLYAQTLDENFLASLDDDVRIQLLNEMNSKEIAANKKNFRVPSTELSKKELDSDKFGVRFFRTLQTTFMPINEPTFDPSYILGVGDELLIQFTGQKNDILQMTVNRDGAINLPEIGKVVVSGLSLARVDQLLKAKIKQAFIGVEVFTTLTSIRDMQILVVGEAAYPGVYTLPGNASLLNILAAAGGFNEQASLRSIEIMRGGKTLSNIDLYQAFVYGDFSKINTPLRSGDTVFIKPTSFEVRIQGGVRRSAVYELLPDEGYAELLEFANGYKNTAKQEEIQLTRVANQRINYELLSDAQLRQAKLLHEDTLTVQSIETIRVVIEGAVDRPGSYILPERSTILELINLAGGYKDQAYPFGAIYQTASAKQKELDSIQRMRRELLNFIATTPMIDDKKFDVKLLLGEFDQLEPLGRVSVDISMNSLRNLNQNIELQSGDSIKVPNFENIVHIYGEVQNPGSFVFKTATAVRDYIRLAGDKKKDASDKIILYHPNGVSQVINYSRAFSFNSPETFIYPGTLIYIPREHALSSIETSRLYLPIVSNLALTMASIASISNSTK